MGTLTWEAFWLPNIIQATLFATLAAAVGLLARWLLKRWLGVWANTVLIPWLAQMFGEQQKSIDETKAEAKAAKAEGQLATAAARVAAERSSGAERAATESNETSRLNSAGIVDLKDRYDDLLGNYYSLLGFLRGDPGDGDDGGRDGAEMVEFLQPTFTTGRHRFDPNATQIMPVTGSQETT